MRLIPAAKRIGREITAQNDTLPVAVAAPAVSAKLGWKGGFFEFLNEKLDFGVLGYIIVGMFLAAWLVSAALWKLRRVEERYGGAVDGQET